MTWLFYLAVGVVVAAVALWYRMEREDREVRHQAWLRDYEHRQRSQGVDLSCWKWPAKP